jgi:hypothetical protein
VVHFQNGLRLTSILIPFLILFDMPVHSDLPELMATLVRTFKATFGRYAIESHAWPGFSPSNIVNPNILECINLFIKRCEFQ